MMPGIADPARDAGQPKLERDAEGVGKDNPDIERRLPPRISRRTAGTTFLPNEITSSTSGTSRQTAAILAGARTVTCASGRPRLIARTAGMLMTLSPSQLLARIRIRNGCSCSPLRDERRRACICASSQFGRGVFQRLWTQNQSSGARRICSAIASLVLRGQRLGTLSLGASERRAESHPPFPRPGGVKRGRR